MTFRTELNLIHSVFRVNEMGCFYFGRDVTLVDFCQLSQKKRVLFLENIHYGLPRIHRAGIADL